MNKKNETEIENDLKLGAEALPEENPDFLTEQDVTDYELPADIEREAHFYTEEDPILLMHLKRAVKYHSETKESRIAGHWTMTVKGFNPEKTDYSILVMSRTGHCPTTEEIIEHGYTGKFKLILEYYNPYRHVKGFQKYGREQKMRGGWTTITSREFSVMGKTAKAPETAAPKFDMKAMLDFESTMSTINATANQAMALQMQALANRQQIVNEGVALGRLQKELELTKKERDTFHQQTLDMQTLMQEIQSKQGGGMLDGLLNIARMIQNPENGGGEPSKT